MISGTGNDDGMLTPTGYPPPTQQPARPTAHTGTHRLYIGIYAWHRLLTTLLIPASLFVCSRESSSLGCWGGQTYRHRRNTYIYSHIRISCWLSPLLFMYTSIDLDVWDRANPKLLLPFRPQAGEFIILVLSRPNSTASEEN